MAIFAIGGQGCQVLKNGNPVGGCLERNLEFYFYLFNIGGNFRKQRF